MGLSLLKRRKLPSRKGIFTFYCLQKSIFEKRLKIKKNFYIYFPRSKMQLDIFKNKIIIVTQWRVHHP
jgi:hypothetical protein